MSQPQQQQSLEQSTPPPAEGQLRSFRLDSCDYEPPRRISDCTIKLDAIVQVADSITIPSLEIGVSLNH